MPSFKKISIFFLFQVSFFILNAQTNLVPNSSFEDTLSCPTNGSISNLQNWINPTAYSPDCFHSCVSSSGWGYSIPNNTYGQQIAKTGTGYAGIITHFSGASNSPREYIQINLQSTLIAAEKYLVRFFVMLVDSSNYAVNDFGAFFSNGPVSSSNTFFLPYTPQIQNNSSTNPLSTKNSWIMVSDTLTANGNENYLTIGNFKPDITTNTVSVSGGASWMQYSYYYIDDVTVSKINSIGIIESEKVGELGIFPIPSSEKLFIKSSQKIESIRLSDFIGNNMSIDFSIPSDDNVFTIDVSKLVEGIYQVFIKTDSGTYSKKIIIKK